MICRSRAGVDLRGANADAVAAGLDAAQLENMRRTFNAWTEQFRTELGVTIPIDYLVTVGNRV
jgi:hypothetical protein